MAQEMVRCTSTYEGCLSGWVVVVDVGHDGRGGWSVVVPRVVVFEELWSPAWLSSELERARAGCHRRACPRPDPLARVSHGGSECREPLERTRLHQTFARDSTGIKDPIRSVLRSRGVAFEAGGSTRKMRGGPFTASASDGPSVRVRVVSCAGCTRPVAS